MELKDMIYRRKSVRSYTKAPVDGETVRKISEFPLKPLYPDIRVHSEIISSESVRCILPWTTEQVIAIFSEETDGALENAGFMYQQLDLYIQSLGLGSCWLGMGRLDSKLKSKDDLSFVIMIAFGYPKSDPKRKSTSEFKRKALSDISDISDERLEPARLAPSSVNSQPWYFTHNGDTVNAYCALSGIFRKKTPLTINLVDMGIALAHLYVTNEDTFRFFREKAPAAVKNYKYIGSFSL